MLRISTISFYYNIFNSFQRKQSYFNLVMAANYIYMYFSYFNYFNYFNIFHLITILVSFNISTNLISYLFQSKYFNIFQFLK
jgi:hypothetical protein